MIGPVVGSLDLALDDMSGGRWTVIILCRGYVLLIQPILGEGYAQLILSKR